MQGNSRHVLFMLVILLIPLMYYTQDIDYQISEKNELTDSFNAYQSEESLERDLEYYSWTLLQHPNKLHLLHLYSFAK